MSLNAVTPAIIRALNTTFQGTFRNAYQSAPSIVPDVTTPVPSSSKSNTYGWMKKIPQMRKWVGERVIHGLSSHGYAIENEDYELTLGVDRNDFADDNLGQYDPLMRMLGENAAMHPQRLLIDLLNNGHLSTATCFDGQNFFDTDHPVSAENAALGTQSNYQTSQTLSTTSLFAMRAVMAAFKGDDNVPMGITANILLVPPALEKLALETVVALTVSTGGANVAATLGMRVIVVPELGGDATKDKTWYLLDTTKVLRPFIHQMREPTKLVSMTDVTDTNVFMHKEFIWGVDGRYALGYGPWFLAMKMVGS
jgi:phage major head subunit gpT-like protein